MFHCAARLRRQVLTVVVCSALGHLTGCDSSPALPTVAAPLPPGPPAPNVAANSSASGAAVNGAGAGAGLVRDLAGQGMVGPSTIRS